MSFRTEFLQHCRDAQLVGAQVSVFSGDDYQLDLAYGLASLAGEKPVTLETIFRIASISKIVVAMAVLQLVEKQLVGLDDDIGSILGFNIRNPHHPDKKITIRMLMTQTSSITDGPEDDSRAGYNNVNGTYRPATLRDLLVPNDGKYYTNKTWLAAVPGEAFNYSNFGCGILACIVEKVTGEYFTDYVAKNILRPLGLDASFRADEIKNKAAIANLYYGPENGGFKLSRSGESFIASVYPHFPLGENYRGPAGGLFISMRDLMKIARLLVNDGVVSGHRVLEKDTVDQMLQLQWYGVSENYRAKGLQLRFMDFDGKTFKGHTGSAYGAISYLFINREEKLGICFITNGGKYRPGTVMCDVQENIFRSFLNHYWPKQEREHVFSAAFGSAAGMLDDRVIRFSFPLELKDDDVYLPITNVADIFNIVPDAASGDVILRFRGREYVAVTPMLSLREVCATFNAGIRLENGKIEIRY
ncbi:MAG TPA: serine hydrolase [Acholeplasmataceae bacterium]|nr:serine hydrolase [Acholeplasmataceae bacterium]